MQNGEVIVRPSIDMIRAGSQRWNTTAVGYFLGKKPYFHHLNEFVRSIWPGVRDVKATSNGFFFFQFNSVAAMEEVIEEVLGCILGNRSCYKIASGIGRPLYPDAITRTCTRLDFARVCVMLHISSKLPKHVVIMMPNELGGESACKVDVEYEWLPPKCTGCSSLGHSVKECPLSKPTKPAVSLYVRKSMPPKQAAPELKMSEQSQVDRVRKKSNLKLRPTGTYHQGVLTHAAPQMFPHVKYSVLECSGVLHSNATRIQSGVLSRWRWFVDYAGPVYGANVSTRRELWQGLIDLADTVDNEPWLVGGDFNAVLDMSEVSGASGDIRGAMNEFNDCILQTGLLSLPMQGERFTWHNCSLDGRSLWKRLDRLLANDVWMDRWPNMYYSCLTPRTSDHSPLVLKGDCRNLQVSLFRFDNYLALSPGFLESVHSIWHHPIVGTRMYSVTRKLKALKLVYLKASKIEQVMLRQRAKMQWLKGGDQCSRVFFRRVATRRANKRGLLGGDRTDRAMDLQYLRPWARHILTDEEARTIIRPVTIDEVKTAFFDIEEDKAPGPDGFSSGFFKAAWPVVGEEVANAIRDFFKTGRLLKQLNATLLTLIPKVRNPQSVADFRPISCCNVIYKAITKILVSRIREILDLLISPSQNAFVPGRLISDNVLLAQELFSGYNQCRLPPRCALKVDLRKAYDTVEWDFCLLLCECLAFPLCL
ncbi:hypothetical protein Sango_3037200 [Sesamum angolense]|uniref:Reverse transcriptase domain-containing protein n=1 Tax=Sesamum angolense TaxID=2727404 RepID=A0AAE1TAK3_9LAMI|nr:hypothetical protein Sango_3037200 [Sesamum angolense]